MGSVLVETHVMSDDWMVRYVSNASGRDWMVLRKGWKFQCLRMKTEKKSEGISRYLI